MFFIITIWPLDVIPIQNFHIRPLKTADQAELVTLYKLVVKQGGYGGLSIANSPNDITGAWVKDFCQSACTDGLGLVLETTDVNQHKIVAETHAVREKPAFMHHILNNLIIVVSPAFQGQGIGKTLLTSLQKQIIKERPDILRLELSVFASHQAALRLYKSCGFVVEGQFKQKFFLSTGYFENEVSLVWFNPGYQQHPTTKGK